MAEREGRQGQLGEVVGQRKAVLEVVVLVGCFWRVGDLALAQSGLVHLDRRHTLFIIVVVVFRF